MNKKIIIIAILAIFLTATFSSTVAAKNTSDETQDFGLALIKSEISIEAPSQIDEPIDSSNPKEIEITVKYKLDMGSLAWRFFSNRRIGRFLLFGFEYISKSKGQPSAEIILTADYPKGCTAIIEPSNVSLEMSNEFKEAKATLQISVNESAPALKSTDITIKAEFAGHWTIGETSNTTTISFMPAYKSDIAWEVVTEHTIPPLENTTIPINITNNGNGETIVNIEVEDPPEDWNISLDLKDVKISVGKTKQINLIVKSVKGFDKETIQLKLTPKSTSDADLDDKYLEGEPISLSITLSNDGSLEEEEGIGIETILLIAFVIIIVIVALILLLMRKKQ